VSLLKERKEKRKKEGKIVIIPKNLEKNIISIIIPKYYYYP
jgi:hypothetical protein